MSKIRENGWWSFFSEREQTLLAKKNAPDIASLMLNDPEIALRFIQELLAHNRPQKALDVLNAFDPSTKKDYLQKLNAKIPGEILIYQQSGLTEKELEWYALYLPMMLSLAFNDILTFSPGDNLKIATDAMATREHLRTMGLLKPIADRN